MDTKMEIYCFSEDGYYRKEACLLHIDSDKLTKYTKTEPNCDDIGENLKMETLEYTFDFNYKGYEKYSKECSWLSGLNFETDVRCFYRTNHKGQKNDILWISRTSCNMYQWTRYFKNSCGGFVRGVEKLENEAVVGKSFEEWLDQMTAEMDQKYFSRPSFKEKKLSRNKAIQKSAEYALNHNLRLQDTLLTYNGRHLGVFGTQQEALEYMCQFCGTEAYCEREGKIFLYEKVYQLIRQMKMKTMVPRL